MKQRLHDCYLPSGVNAMLGQTGLPSFQTTWSARLIFLSSGICEAIICLASEILIEIRCPKRRGGTFSGQTAKPYLTPAGLVFFYGQKLKGQAQILSVQDYGVLGLPESEIGW